MHAKSKAEVVVGVGEWQTARRGYRLRCLKYPVSLLFWKCKVYTRTSSSIGGLVDSDETMTEFKHVVSKSNMIRCPVRH